MSGWALAVAVVVGMTMLVLSAVVWACLVVASDADRRAEEQAECWQYLERPPTPDGSS